MIFITPITINSTKWCIPNSKWTLIQQFHTTFDPFIMMNGIHNKCITGRDFTPAQTIKTIGHVKSH